ncbi:MCE family protein [Actinophytocola oryzae]|uniref:Phospholipid/cholesterol/gamma-HCH transport system substrate-binding protein n=1 Tax=Actinophytocola oryzae TaxID=502181 RepID=A0A4R7W1E3_9PSEU|nr:MlaD family protein [Actinophytocola oryzae]TDV55357.1 phospholipid/cholesterol/gamma-HCH transport system substrate-binding protein [Actinophytocola oryzae]
MLNTKKRFRERDPRKVGIVGVLAVVALLVLALSSGSLYRALTSVAYSAWFAEAGGLSVGADVRIGGLTVGEVESVALARGHVKVGFTVAEPGNLGARTGAAIKTATPLGVRFLAVLPEGTGRLAPGAEIPLDRTSSPYDLAAILGQVTQHTEQLDTGRLAEALDTVADTLKDTPDELRTTLDGVNRLAQTVAGQDQALRDLLSRADTVTGVLAQRNRELAQLFDDGTLLLGELNRHRTVISQLLTSTATLLDQLTGLVHDNQRQLEPALQQLQGVLDLLNADDHLLGSVIQGLNAYTGSLGESVGGGPWFYGYIPNLPPTNLAPLLPDVLKALGP